MDRLVKGLVFFCFLFVAVQDVYASSKIFIAYAGVTSGVATLWISEEQGFFRKYGVDADVIAIRNTPTQLAALISGDIQIGFGGGSAVVGAAPGRTDLKIIATFVNSMILNMVVRPEIKRIEDLRGKRLGVQSLGGTSWMYTFRATARRTRSSPGQDQHRGGWRQRGPCPGPRGWDHRRDRIF
jgi:ABC-type nitrate/sulfonate/bicarbonate transport system substrate-binding protein